MSIYLSPGIVWLVHFEKFGPEYSNHEHFRVIGWPGRHWYYHCANAVCHIKMFFSPMIWVHIYYSRNSLISSFWGFLLLWWVFAVCLFWHDSQAGWYTGLLYQFPQLVFKSHSIWPDFFSVSGKIGVVLQNMYWMSSPFSTACLEELIHLAKTSRSVWHNEVCTDRTCTGFCFGSPHL